MSALRDVWHWEPGKGAGDYPRIWPSGFPVPTEAESGTPGHMAALRLPEVGEAFQSDEVIWTLRAAGYDGGRGDLSDPASCFSLRTCMQPSYELLSTCLALDAPWLPSTLGSESSSMPCPAPIS